MANVYLYFNAGLYALFALWCTLAPTRTAQGVGYESLSRSGLSEYLVVYGGLELGLGLFFFYCIQAGAQRIGLVFAVLLYAPIVVYRIATVARQWPVSSTTLLVGTLEVLLLLAALALWWRQRV
ncbi:MAG TPA: DUF4345 domain-containing protein [Dokdonella sp.]